MQWNRFCVVCRSQCRDLLQQLGLEQNDGGRPAPDKVFEKIVGGPGIATMTKETLEMYLR